MKEWKKLITDGPVMRFLSFLVLSLIVTLFFIFDTLVLNMRVRGRRNLRKLRGRGCIVISNHTLFVEGCFISHAIFPRHPYFSIMEQTFVNPIAEWGLRLLRGFPIPHRKGMERMEPEIARVLKHKGTVHFFPEGNLIQFNQEPLPFKKGAFLAAIKNQEAVLPVATVVHHRKFRGKILWNYLFRLTMVISEPMIPPPCPENRENLLKAASEMAHEAHKIVSDSIKEWSR
jgi:1-acyl-sn-glycerol-3-phosphate acyltransferase